MTVETVTYISDLNSTYPVGTDAKSEGDDHIRNIKAGLLASFPNFAGAAMTLTEAELNTTYLPAGTLMLFQQTAAPTGWTKETTHNDKGLRVVSGTASSGGTSSFSTVFGKTATDGHTLTEAEMPSHNHLQGHRVNSTTVSIYGYTSTSSNVGVQSAATETRQPYTSTSGSDSAHTHDIDIRVQYVDLIIASKDA